MERIVFENINPFVRYAQFLTISSNRQYVNLAPYDYRLFSVMTVREKFR